MSGPSASSSRPVTLRLALECDLGEVRSAIQNIRDFLAGQGWNTDQLMSFDLALAEACNNAIQYADEAGRKKPLVLETLAGADQVEFHIHDHTPGFKWPAKFELPEPESESGRGLFLINSLMDYAGYFRGQGANILVMRKNRPAGTVVSNPGNETDNSSRLAENERIISEMVEELSSCYESLSAIFRYSTAQSKAGTLRDFAQRLGSDLLQIVSAEWFILRLVPKGESRLVVFAASEPALELEPLAIPPSGKPVVSLEIEAAVTHRSVWFHAQKPPPVAGPLNKAKPGSSGMVQPILQGEELIGTLTLGKASPPTAPPMPGQLVFTAGQTNVINTFADFLAIQIANARFQEEQVSQRLVRHELEIANNIQRSLLLSTLPRLPGFNIAAFCRSAHEVGGDFYDVLKIGDDSLLLVIADVMGKGIPAAMFAAMLRTLLRAAPELTQQPAALLGRVNRLLFPELSGVDMFITVQLAFVDAMRRKITIASAGHCPLAIATPAGVLTFSPEGMPLGIVADASFQEETVDLPENSRILLYTDGLTDALNVKQQRFGQQRLLDWLVRATKNLQTVEQLKDDLAYELEKYQLHAPLSDDQTFLIMSG